MVSRLSLFLFHLEAISLCSLLLNAVFWVVSWLPQSGKGSDVTVAHTDVPHRSLYESQTISGGDKGGSWGPSEQRGPCEQGPFLLDLAQLNIKSLCHWGQVRTRIGRAQ